MCKCLHCTPWNWLGKTRWWMLMGSHEISRSYTRILSGRLSLWFDGLRTPRRPWNVWSETCFTFRREHHHLQDSPCQLLIIFEIKCTIMWDHFKGPCFVNFGPMVKVTATCSQANYLAMTAVLLVALQLNNLRLALQPWWVRRSWALERHIQTFYRVAHEEIKMEHKIRAVLHGSQDPNTSPLQDLVLG